MSVKPDNWRDRFYLVLLKLFSYLPIAFVTGFGAVVAGLFTWVPLQWSSAFRVCLVNIMLSNPELSYREAAKLARSSMRQTGRSFMEFAHVWTQPPERSLARISEVTGMATLRTAYQHEQPVLLLTLHQSSWELPNLLIAQEGPMTVFYQVQKNAMLNELVKQARESTGSELVPANKRGIRAGLAAMSRNQAVAILADHNPDGQNNPLIPFFGHKVRTSNLPHKFIQRYQPAVFFVGCHRGEDKAKDVRVYIEPAPQDIYDADETVALGAMNRTLEELIKRYPDQYHWAYKRFRRINEAKTHAYHRKQATVLRKARKQNRAITLTDLI